MYKNKTVETTETNVIYFQENIYYVNQIRLMQFLNFFIVLLLFIIIL